jgi:hypothetical protein
MKKICSSFVFLAFACNAFAQNPSLLSFEKKHAAINKTGMMVLGSYAAANIAVSAVALKGNKNEAHYFNQMNIIWNGFNLGLAGLGYLGASRKKPGNSSLNDILKQQHKTEKIFLFNAGLDVAYIAGGAYLKEIGNNKTDPSRLTGYGNAVMVNGGFLFLFDIVMYALHNKHGKQLNNFIEKLQVTGTGNGITATYTF